MLNKLYAFFAKVGLKRSIMIFFSVVLAIITITISGIFYFIMQSEIAEEGKSNIRQTLNQANKNVGYTVNFYEKILYYLCGNYYLRQQLDANVATPYNKFAAVTEVQKILTPFKDANPNIRKIEIYVENSALVDNELFYSKNNAWYISMLEKPQNYTEIKYCKGKVQTISGLQIADDVIQISKQIVDVGKGRVLGVMSLYISMQEISTLLDGFSVSSNGSVVIIDSNRNVIYQSKNYQPYMLAALDENFDENVAMEAVKKINNENWWIISNQREKGNINVIAFVNEKIFSQKVYRSQSLFILVLIGLFCIGMLFSFFVSRFITKELDDLVYKIKRISSGDYTLSGFESRSSYTGEIGYLHLQFDNMIKKINTLINDVYQEKISRRDNELRLLQSQINSHFLYNTLSSINWMAINISAFDISRAINALAKYYRISLSRGKEFITIHDEIEHVKSYIIIQMMRFKDRFDVVYEISEEIRDCYTPKIILQPFVENAIIHGFNSIEYSGKIVLKAYQKEEQIEFIIKDNGCGFTKAVEPEDSHEQSNKSGSGYGIRNVDEKIKLLYGDDFGVSVKNGDMNGVTVVIRIPIIHSLQ